VADGSQQARLNRWQRMALKRITKQARKRPGEPLDEDDWIAYFRFTAQPRSRAIKRVMRALPSTPRCGFCGAPFSGWGAKVVRPLGYQPSRKNPHVCATCVELAPPGGTTMQTGVLFADLRGFTSQSESASPAEVNERLRRFYAHAERVLFPEALIDKLIGDEVMALYLPVIVAGRAEAPDGGAQHEIARVMVRHALALLAAVGYGSASGPEFDVGIGLDVGEAFIGNLGDTAVHDFTAVGDVVNTASRLQGAAAGGEVIVSQRVIDLLDAPVGVPEQITLKGKREPVAVHRLRWSDPR
jgi:adenylate cyclase